MNSPKTTSESARPDEPSVAGNDPISNLGSPKSNIPLSAGSDVAKVETLHSEQAEEDNGIGKYVQSDTKIWDDSHESQLDSRKPNDVDAESDKSLVPNLPSPKPQDSLSEVTDSPGSIPLIPKEIDDLPTYNSAESPFDSCNANITHPGVLESHNSIGYDASISIVDTHKSNALPESYQNPSFTGSNNSSGYLPNSPKTNGIITGLNNSSGSIPDTPNSTGSKTNNSGSLPDSASPKTTGSLTGECDNHKLISDNRGIISDTENSMESLSAFPKQNIAIPQTSDRSTESSDDLGQLPNVQRPESTPEDIPKTQTSDLSTDLLGPLPNGLTSSEDTPATQISNPCTESADLLGPLPNDPTSLDDSPKTQTSDPSNGSTCPEDTSKIPSTRPPDSLGPLPSPVLSPKTPSSPESPSSPVQMRNRKRMTSSSSSKSSRCHTLASIGETPSEDLSDVSDDDAGIYAESHRKSHWVKVDGPRSQTNHIDKTPLTAAQLNAILHGSKATANKDDVFDTIDSPQSFAKSVTKDAGDGTRFKRIRKCLVQRHQSQQEFYRLSQQFYDNETTVTLTKENHWEGFGLHIFDSHPAVVSAVDSGSSAEVAGISAGQVVIAVNGTNVLHESHETIISLISYNPIRLELQLAPVSSLPSRDLQAPLYAGSLSKLSGSTKLLKFWQKRWFVLRQDNCLYYYKSGQDVDPIGAIPLSNYRLCKAVEVKKPNVFKLDNAGAKSYYLMAASERDMSKWTSAIAEAARLPAKTATWLDISTHNVGLPALSISHPDCCGYLAKVGQSGRVWRRRFCVLKDACMYYYKNIDSPNAQGMAHLHGYTLDNSGQTSKRFAIGLLPPDSEMRRFTFAADNETDMLRWVEALKNSISRWVCVS